MTKKKYEEPKLNKLDKVFNFSIDDLIDAVKKQDEKLVNTLLDSINDITEINLVFEKIETNDINESDIEYLLEVINKRTEINEALKNNLLKMQEMREKVDETE
jgi:hypothetical protein